MNPFVEPLTCHRRYTVAPRTWVPGELVTAGMMNSIRDNLNEVGMGGVSVPNAQSQDLVAMVTPTQMSFVRPAAGKVPRFHVSGTYWENVFPTAGNHDSFIGAAGMLPTVGASVPCGYHETLYNGYGNFVVLPFSGTATQQASFTMQMPRSWDLGPYHVSLLVINKSGYGGAGYWTTYAGSMYPPGGAIAWQPANGAGVAPPVVAAAMHMHQVDMGWQNQSQNPYGPTIGCALNFLVQRVAAAAEDTNQDFLYLVGARIIINTTKDSDG